jgi:hypothetical protein
MLTTVVIMLPAQTLLVASPVPVTRDTPAQEMVSLVQVSHFFCISKDADRVHALILLTYEPQLSVQHILGLKLVNRNDYRKNMYMQSP